jgi:hypothetical protein
MLRFFSAALSSFVLIGASVTLLACSSSTVDAVPELAGPSAGADRVSAEAGSAVILELFTSQGCSSCPPADDVLSRVGREAASKGRVIPLAFHVDYWNRIGWADPFSAGEWSERQRVYSSALGLDGLYTPQLIVGGQAQFVGSNEERVRQEIAAALATQPASRIALATKTAGGAAVTVNITAEVLRDVDDGNLRVTAALFENALVTPIRRGENSGRTLANDFVVRRLERGAEVESEAGARYQGVMTFEVDPAWKIENLGVAVFLQDERTMRIHGAAAQSLR